MRYYDTKWEIDTDYGTLGIMRLCGTEYDDMWQRI